jgi:hypothetical protein
MTGARRKDVFAHRPDPRSRLAFECVAAMLDDGCPLLPYSPAADAFVARQRASLIASTEAAALRRVELSGGGRMAADPEVRELARRTATLSVNLLQYKSSYYRHELRSTGEVRSFLQNRGRDGWEFPRRIAADVIGAAHLASGGPWRSFWPLARSMNEGIPTGAARLDGDHIRNAVSTAERVLVEQLSALSLYLSPESAATELAKVWLSAAARREALYRQAVERRLSLDAFVDLFLSGEALRWVERWWEGFAGPDRAGLQRTADRLLSLKLAAVRTEVASLEAEALRRGIDLSAFGAHAQTA